MSKENFATRFGLESGDFYLTAPAPCPYLNGRVERKVFSFLGGDAAASTNSLLTRRGFRRSQNIIYIPACENCSACVPVRIVVDDFELTKSRKRIVSRNSDVVRKIVGPHATGEQFSVLRGYLDSRHTGGGMSDMTVLDYASMVEETSVDTVIMEYRLAEKGSSDDGRLIAACLTDRLSDGLSMVYSFFEPDVDTRSLGRYMILDHLSFAAELNLPYLYLGYCVDGSDKMQYKADFQPLEKLTRAGWVRMDKQT